MQTTGSMKLGVAFLAGVALALGGAFIYLKASDPEVQPLSQAATRTLVVETLSPEVTAPAVAVSQAPAKQPAKQAVVPPPHVVAKTKRPLSLAVWRPRQEPQPTPAIALDPPPDVAVTPPAATQSAPVAETTSLPPAQLQPHTVTIPAGTNLTVRLNENLSTEHNYSGDTFRATLDAPIVMDGFIIADRGAKVLGRVSKVQKPGKVQGMAELSLVLTEVATTDGQRLQVETNESLRKGASNTNEEVIKMAGGAALGAIIGAIAGGGRGAAIGAGAGGAAGTGAVLLGRGKPAVIQSETRLIFEMASAATITEHLN